MADPELPAYDATTAKPLPQEDLPAYDPKTAKELPKEEPNTTTQPIAVDHDKLGMAFVNAHMLNVPMSSTLNNHDQIHEAFNKLGLDAHKSTNSIATDIKTGAKGTIFAMQYRHKLPEPLKDPNMADKFITGLSQMVGDLPIYIAGSIFGSFAGSEVPGVGNFAGGAMGTFAVPDAMRQAVVDGIQKGNIKSFGDLMERTASASFAAAKGAATGLAVEAAGVPLVGKTLGPVEQYIIKNMQQSSVMTGLSVLFDKHIPNVSDFAVNSALMAAIHVSMASIEKASGVAPKVQEKSFRVYAEDGTHPAKIAAEALRQAQESPTEDVIGRMHELTRKDVAKDDTEKPADTAKEDQVIPQPPPPLLRPAIKAEDGTVTIGGEGTFHSDITDGNAGLDKGESGYVDSKDEFHTKDEAKAKLHEEQPEVYDHWQRVAGHPEEEFHATDYNEAMRRSTGIKNASVDVQRAQEGLPPIESPMRSLDPDNWEQAKEDVNSGRVDPLGVARAINENPRGMSPEETNAVNYYRAQLSDQHKSTMDAIEQARDDDDPQAEQRAREQLREVEDRINTVDEGTKRAGTEWGLSGLQRQRTVAQNYSLDRLLQRARVQSKDGEVPPQLRDQLEGLTRKLENANKEIEQYQNKLSEDAGRRAINKIQEGIKREGRKQARKEERVSLDEEFSNLVKDFDSLIMGRMSANPMFDPEVIGLLGKMARNRVESGLTRIEDIVDYIHGQFTDIGHDVTKRDIRDAISGYGKTFEMSKDEIDVAMREAKRQGKLISALEDAKAALLPMKSGLQRDAASDRVMELQREVRQAMRDSGVDIKPTMTPEHQWKIAIASVKTRLNNQISDLSKRLITLEKAPARKGAPEDAETVVLKAARDTARRILETLHGKPKVSPERKLKMAMDATQKSIDEYERRIKENDLTPQQRRSGTPETPQLKSLRERRDGLRETFRQMQEAAKPKKSPEDVRLERYKKHLTNRIADIERQLSTGDFTKEPQKQTVLDPEATELKLKSQRLRNQVDEAMAKQKLANRTKTERAVDFITKWRRAGLLTGYSTLGKLTKAAMDRMGVTPVEELLGGVLSHIPGIDEVSKRAPMHGGGFNPSAEVQAVSQLWQKATANDMWEEMKTGQDSLDLLFGGRAKLPPEVLGMIGQLHGALKVPEKRAEFFRRLDIGMEYAKQNHLDVGDPRVQAAVISKIQSRAYDESLRAILMQDNVLTDAYNVALSYLHNKGVAGRTIEGGSRFIFPMVKIATNLPAETVSYNPLNLAYQTVQTIRLLADKDRMGKSALDNLSMHDMDNIMRGFKKGSVGLLLFSIGFGLRKNVTGYYTTAADRKNGIKRGVVKIGSVEIPAYLNDSPPMMAIQFAATIGHVWDHYNMKGMAGGLIAGSVQATEELAKRVPFYGQVARMADAQRTPESSMVGLGDFAGSLMIPRLVSQIAEFTDSDKKRMAKTASEAIKLQIPGLRETVGHGKSDKFRTNRIKSSVLKAGRR